MDATTQVARSLDLSTKVAQLYGKRTKLARERFSERIGKAYAECASGLAERPLAPADAWSQWNAYATDVAQRSILFWNTLRERGNDFVEHNREGLTPVLHFDYETVVDGRTLARPVNYALVRIIPPEGVKVDSKLRPYVIIDPRAGHGPGIGGFKDDSQVGVALREGHPVYFVIFFRDPEPGQTLLDVCDCRAAVREDGARAAPGERETGDRRQLPGRLGGDDAGGRGPGRHRPDRHQRRADVVLGRRIQRRRGRQPDALRRRHARRNLAVVVRGRHGQRHLRWRLPGREFREPQSGQYVLGQVLQPLRECRHRTAALPRVRALVGWVLPHEPRGDRVDHAQPLRRQQALDRHPGCGRQVLRPARHQGADHSVRVDGRQHHAAAAGVQLGGRRLRLDRRDQGARSGHRRIAASGHRPSRHLRFRQGRQEGACADRRSVEVDRNAAAGSLRNAHPRGQGPRR